MLYKISKKDHIYLSAFIRKVEMSLIRREFLKDRKLQEYFVDIEKQIVNAITFEKTPIYKYQLFYIRHYITSEELETLMLLLKEFKEYIISLNSSDHKLMNLRVKLIEIQSKLRRRLKKADKRKVDKIEYYNHYNILNTVSLENLNS